MTEAPADFNARIIEEFRANDGRVGGMFEGATLLILHTKGAKSGTDYATPLVYLEDDGRYVVFASKGGAPEHPGWYHNLKAHPDIVVEVGAESVPVTATEAPEPERQRLFDRQVERMPSFAGYQENIERVIPVMVLTP